MTATFITPSVVANTGIETLYNTIVLAGLVWRDFDDDFTGKQGDTVTIRKPAVFEAVDFNQTTRTTEYQDATEDSIDVTLDHLSHVPFHVTDEQATLEISDYEEQLLNPAMEALAQKVDGELANDLISAARDVSHAAHLADDPRTPDEANFVFRRSRSILGRAKLPQLNRVAVVSPEAASEVLGDKTLLEADKSGSTEALRNAIMGRLLGFDTYESQVFGWGPGLAGHADGAAFHKSAVALAVRPLQKPRGVDASRVATSNYKGLALRVIYSYDEDAKMDKTVVDILYGTAETRPEGVVELDFGQGS